MPKPLHPHSPCGSSLLLWSGRIFKRPSGRFFIPAKMSTRSVLFVTYRSARSAWECSSGRSTACLEYRLTSARSETCCSEACLDIEILTLKPQVLLDLVHHQLIDHPPRL
ncbi:hypothetical protein, partial [Pseudomonas coronafaciens]